MIASKSIESDPFDSAATQREAPGDRLWSPQNGQILLRYPAREYEDASPRSPPAPDQTMDIQVGNWSVYTREYKRPFLPDRASGDAVRTHGEELSAESRVRGAELSSAAYHL